MVCSAARIKQIVATVKEVVGDRCQVFGTPICKNGGSLPKGETADLILRVGKAVKEAGADGFGIYPDLAMLDWDQFWGRLKELGSKFRKT